MIPLAAMFPRCIGRLTRQRVGADAGLGAVKGGKTLAKAKALEFAFRMGRLGSCDRWTFGLGIGQHRPKTASVCIEQPRFASVNIDIHSDAVGQVVPALKEI